MRRDRLTFAMMIGMPADAARAVRLRDQLRPEAPADRACSPPITSPYARTLRARRCENTGYFDIVARGDERGRGRRRCSRAARCSSCVQHPAGLLARRCCAASGRHCWSRPTPPTRPPPATRSARSASWRSIAPATTISTGRFDALQAGAPPFELRVHRRYNPEGITQYNIVPGLMGVILTMTMVMITGARDDARARARHDGEPARDAGAPGRGDDRQDRALHPRRLRPGRA